MQGEVHELVGELVRATKARRRRKPSPRNLCIYHTVRVEGELQINAAAHYGLTQTRISAICRQVAAWRRQEDAERGEDFAAARELAHRRLEMLYGRAVRGLQESSTTVSTNYWEQKPDGSVTRKTINREQTFDIRWLKEAKQNALLALEMVEQRAPTPATPPGRGAELVDRVLRIVARLRRTIRQEGVTECVPQILEQALRLCEQEDTRPVKQLSSEERIPDRANYAAPAREENGVAPEVVAAEACQHRS